VAKDLSDDIGNWAFEGDDFASCYTALNAYFDWNASALTPDQAFIWKMNVVRFGGLEGAVGNMSVGKFRTSGGYRQIRLAEESDFIVVFPIKGWIGLHYDQKIVAVHSHQAAIYQPLALNAFEAFPTDGKFEVGFIQLSFAFAQKFLSETLHHPVERDLNLSPLIDRSSGKSRLLLSVISLICDGDFHTAGLNMSASLRKHIIETFSQLLMEIIPHRYSARLRSQQAVPMPNHIRLAQKFMERHTAELPRMADVARAAKVSVRTLEMNFRTYLDMTPRTYMRVVRLRMARHALLSHAETRPIAEIAESFGFTHKSRFSKYYADLFGETPSATRRHGDHAPMPT
jgi:AraC-like DNA-binding protein